MDENMIVRFELRQPKVKEVLEKVITSMEGFKLQEEGAPLSCDLLILEIGEELEKEFQLIQNIQDSGIAREIFLTSPRLEPHLLIQAMRAGAKEFFPQPIQEEEVKAALLKYKERKGKVKSEVEKKTRGKIIDVIGSKGGVGNTTMAVNLATSLVESSPSPRVALIDMNLLFGEIPIFLNIESSFDWGGVARDISRLDPTFLMSILSKHSSGVYVLPSPTGLDGVNVATPEIIEKILRLMRSVFDFIVIDGGQAIDDISLKILEMSDTVLLIGILSLPCLTNVKRLLWIFQKLGFPLLANIKIIINRHTDRKSVIPPEEAEKSINQKIFWFVPNDYPTTMSAINQGKTLSAVAPTAEVSKNLKSLASVFLEGQGELKEKTIPFWRKFFNLRNIKIESIPWLK
jgi:pilus assembly protein CpaE